MDLVRKTGRKMVFWGGLLLTLWALMDLFSQSALLSSTIQGSTWRAYQDGALTLQQFVQYLPWNTLWVPLFLLGCAILGIVALCTSRRPAVFMLLFMASLAALYVVLQTPKLFSWLGLSALWRVVNVAKIVSLALVAVGSALSLAAIRYFRHRRREAAQRMPPAGTRRFHPD